MSLISEIAGRVPEVIVNVYSRRIRMLKGK